MKRHWKWSRCLQEIVRLKVAIAIANAKGSAVDLSDTQQELCHLCGWIRETWRKTEVHTTPPSNPRNLRKMIRKASRVLKKLQGIFLEVSRGHNGHNAKTPFFLKACDQAAPTDRGAGGKGFPGDMAFCSFAYHRTQILRDGFDCHFDGPVDTDADTRFKLNLWVEKRSVWWLLVLGILMSQFFCGILIGDAGSPEKCSLGKGGSWRSHSRAGSCSPGGVWEIYSRRLDLLTYRDFFLLALCSFTGWGAFGPNGEILRAAAEGGALWGRFGPWQNESTGHDLWSKWSVKLWSNPITLSVFASFSIHEHFHIFVICSPWIFVVRNKTVVLRNLEVKEFRRQSELQGNSVSQDRFDGKHFDVNMWHFWVLFPRKRTSQKLENWLKSSVFLARILRYAWMPRNMNHEWRWICYWKMAG